MVRDPLFFSFSFCSLPLSLSLVFLSHYSFVCSALSCQTGTSHVKVRGLVKFGGSVLVVTGREGIGKHMLASRLPTIAVGVQAEAQRVQYRTLKEEAKERIRALATAAAKDAATAQVPWKSHVAAASARAGAGASSDGPEVAEEDKKKEKEEEGEDEDKFGSLRVGAYVRPVEGGMVRRKKEGNCIILLHKRCHDFTCSCN